MASCIMNIYSCLLKTGYNINNMRMFMWQLRKNYIMPTQNIFLMRKIPRVGIPKSTVLVITFRVFMWLLSLTNVGPRSIIHLQCFKMLSFKKRESSYKGTMNNETPLSYSYSEMASKVKKKSPCHD